jgi:DNA-binding NtrC family response regulator
MSEKMRLLLVDDELKFLNALCQRLELRGFDVTRAASGEEALRTARNADFALVLLDLKMPGMDGREVLQILKQEHKQLEVIILTGHGSLDAEVECKALGAFGYISKPYDFEELLKIIKDAYMVRLQTKESLLSAENGNRTAEKARSRLPRHPSS